LRKDIELMMARMASAGDDDAYFARLSEVLNEWEKVAMESPLIPPWADRKAARTLGRDNS
jgi:hypothetical protein